MKQHKISLLSAIFMNMNIMIGSGILIGPGFMAAISGNASFLSWIIVAIFFLPIVLSTVALSRMCPGSGGFYAYAKEGLSETAGYWSGFLYIVGYSIAVAFEVAALSDSISQLAGQNFITQNPILLKLIIAGVCVGLNLFSLSILSKVLNSLTIYKLIPLVTLILLIPFIYNPSFTITATEFSFLPQSLTLAIFGFFGFEYACSISHLIENSEKNAPRAIIIGFLATALIYTLFHFGLLNVMGPQALAAMGAQAFPQFITLPGLGYIPRILSLIIPLATIIAIFATANGMINANAIMIHSMAEQKLFKVWPWLVKTSKTGRPWFAILSQGALAFVLAIAFPSLAILGGLSNVGIVSFFLLPFLSLLNLQRRAGKIKNIPLTILAILAIIGLILYSIYTLGDSGHHVATWGEKALYLLPLLGLLAVGALIYKK